MNWHSFRIVALWAVVLCVLGCGCVTNIEKAQASYQNGFYQDAAEAVKEDAETSSDVLPSLYYGSSLFMAGKTDEALQAFLKASEIIENQDHSLNWSGYVAKSYEGFMALTYQALCFLALKQSDHARVVLNRLEDSLGKVQERNRRAIERAQEDLKAERSKPENQSGLGMADSAARDSRNVAQLQDIYSNLRQWGAYADYENPTSRLLSGLYRLFYAEDATDLERAVFQLKRASGMSGTAVSRRIYALAEGVASGKIPRSELSKKVVVLYENGLGPILQEQRIELFIPYHRPVYAGVALPILVQQPAAYPSLSLGAQGLTEPFCDFDRIAATEYRKVLPGIIALEITKAVIKVAVQIVLSNEIEKHHGRSAGLLAGIAGSAISYAITNADTRCWGLLPKNYQVALIDRPSGNVLPIAASTGVPLFQVELPPNVPAIVYVKAPVLGLPAICMLLSPAK